MRIFLSAIAGSLLIFAAFPRLYAEEEKPEGRKAPFTSTYRGGPGHTGFYPGGLGKGYVWEDDISIPLNYRRILYFSAGDYIVSSGRGPGKRMPASFHALDTKDFSEIWNQKGLKNIGAPPTITDGKVLVCQGVMGALQSIRKGSLLAFHAETGKPLWKYATRGAMASSPAVARDTAFFGSGDGFVHAVDISSGKGRWKTRVENRPFGPVLVCRGVAIALSGEFYHAKESEKSSLYGLDAETGEILWTRKDQGFRPEAFHAPFETWGGEIVASVWPPDEKDEQGRPQGHVICLDPKTGEDRWKVEGPAGFFLKQPAISKGIVVFSGSAWVAQEKGSRRKPPEFDPAMELTLFAYSCADGKALWKADMGPWFPLLSPIVADGSVFACGLKELCAIDLETGAEKWRSPVKLGKAVVYARRTLYVLGTFRQCAAFKGETGKELWTKRIPFGADFQGVSIAD